MSGKSTLMRATLVAALLANCGLCIPAEEGSSVPRYDCFFIRTSSYDIPSEGKSAFGLEMDDMRVILRDSTAASIVMIDEIGKGTSSRDGAAIAGALLEYLDQRNVSGIFATHLHELLDLPLNTQRLHRRRMGMTHTREGGEKSPQWTYCLEEGVCTDSMAIATARAFGLPASLLHRAEALGDIFDDKLPVKGEDGGGADDSARSSQQVVTVKGLLQDVLGDYVVSRHLDSKASILYDIVHIPHGTVSPAYLEGQSCLYVLEIESVTENVNEQILYVGESESIAQRLLAHKRNLLKKDTLPNPFVVGSEAGSCSPSVLAASTTRRIGVYCVSVGSKSEARFLETRLISAFKQHGFDIRNDADEKHRRFGSFSN